MLSLKSAIHDLQTYDVKTLPELNHYYDYIIGQVKPSKEKLLKLYFQKYIEVMQLSPQTDCDLDLKWLIPYYANPTKCFNITNLIIVYFEKNQNCNIAFVSNGYIAKAQKTNMSCGRYIVNNNQLCFYQEQDYAIFDLHKCYKRSARINLSMSLQTKNEDDKEICYLKFENVNLSYEYCCKYSNWWVYIDDAFKPAIITQYAELYPNQFVVLMPLHPDLIKQNV